ncbi:MAG: amidohydrolase [Chloroflexota bacterium]|nr:amidohydrolase [Chloroflexota bacterium]
MFTGGPHNAARWPASESVPPPEEAPTAVAVVGERIAAVGTDQELAVWRGPHTELVDARGGLVTAGFDDAHIHFQSGAVALLGVQLARGASLEQIQTQIRGYADERRERSWIVGRGWFYAAFPGGLPTRAQLDAVVPDRPALIDSFDSHNGWANSRALEVAGITRETPDPVGGVIVRDPSTGEPTGALKEQPATDLVRRHAPEPTEDEKLAALRGACRLYAEQGLTSAQDAWAEPEDFELFSRLHGEGTPTARIRLALKMEPGQSERDWEGRLAEYEERAFPRRGDRWLRGGILKGFADGVVESGTAYLLEPYDNREGRGLPNWSDEELRSAVAIAHRRGWQVEVHAIGDGAVRQVLDAYESLGPGEAGARRHRVEHIETIDASDLPRFGQLGVVASMQPYHADPDPVELALWSEAIGQQRARRGWPWKTIQAHGGRLCFGSDWPVRPFEPFPGLNAAVTRATADGEPHGGWLPHERLDLSDALAAYTWGSAYAAHDESRRAVVAPGYLADLAVLDRDLLREGPGAILGTRVLMTVVGGRVVHRLI